MRTTLLLMVAGAFCVGVVGVTPPVAAAEAPAPRLDPQRIVRTVSVVDASPGYADLRVAANTIHFSTGKTTDFGADLQDKDNDPATPLHHPGTFPDLGGEVANQTMFLKSSTTDLFVEYDLGQPQRLECIFIWNYNEAAFTGRGVRELVVSYKEKADESWTALEKQILPIAVNADFDGQAWSNNPAVVPLPAKPIRYLRLDGLTNHGDDGFIGLSEVVFQLAPR